MAALLRAPAGVRLLAGDLNDTLGTTSCWLRQALDRRGLWAGWPPALGRPPLRHLVPPPHAGTLRIGTTNLPLPMLEVGYGTLPPPSVPFFLALRNSLVIAPAAC